MSHLKSQTMESIMENEMTDFEMLDFFRDLFEDIETCRLDVFDTFVEEEKKVEDEKEIIRKQKVAKYLEKKKRRCNKRKILYKVRKSFAETRPRFQGRFLPIATVEFVSVKEFKKKKD